MAYSNQPPRPTPSPIQCAVVLGDAIREEQGKRGVEEYLCALSGLLPPDWIEQIAYHLNVAPPRPRPMMPPQPPPPPPPPRPAPDMEKLMQVVRLMEQMNPRAGGRPKRE